MANIFSHIFGSLNNGYLKATGAGSNADPFIPEVSIGTGTNTLGATKDAGPSQTVTRTYFTSDDCTSTPVDLTTAPGTGLKAVAMDIVVSVDTDCLVNILTESGTNLCACYLAAYTVNQITPRGYIKGATAVKKLQITTSVAAKVRGMCVWFTEA